jgi:hypothetical protein
MDFICGRKRSDQVLDLLSDEVSQPLVRAMIKRSVKTLFCFVTMIGALSTSVVSATMNYLGKWSNTTTNAAGSVTVYNKGIYYSLKSTKASPNRNFVPNANPF